jgi:hypothetical protein
MSATARKRPSRDELERLADEIEGDEFNLSGWMPRPGRPRLDPASTEHAPRLAVRIPASLRRRVERKARTEGRTLSQVVRALLEGYADNR